MASSINASTSGAGGVITTADNSGILNLQSNGTTVATVSSAGLSTTSLSSPNTFGFKNRIINGDFGISQRGTSVTVPAGTTAYTLDRWLVGTNTTTMTATQIGQSTYPYTYMVLTGVAGNTGISISQKIESKNIQDLAGSTVTLSFYYYNGSGNAPSGSVVVSTPTAVDNYTSVTTILSQAVTINAGAIRQTVTFTLPASAANGLQITFGAPSLTSGNLVLFGVQLEAGSQATSFDFRDYGRELMMCQRYYTNNILLNGFAEASVSFCFNITFPVAMRTTPTMSLSGAIVIYDGAANYGQSAAAAGVMTGTNRSAMLYSVGNFSGLTPNRPGNMNPVSSTGTYIASAEL